MGEEGACGRRFSGTIAMLMPEPGKRISGTMDCNDRVFPGHTCPVCGMTLIISERIEYGGENDCRVIPLFYCPYCGLKQRCSSRCEDYNPWR